MQEISSMCGDIVLVYGPAEEMGNFRVIAPGENPRILTVVWKEIKGPKDLTCFKVVRLLRLYSAFAPKDFSDSSM